MASLLRLQLHQRLRAPTHRAVLSFRGRTYASKTEYHGRISQQNRTTEECQSDDYPIPSNKARPALRRDKQAHVTGLEGKVEEEVKQHNMEVKQRHDRPYNRIGEDGNVEASWEENRADSSRFDKAMGYSTFSIL